MTVMAKGAQNGSSLHGVHALINHGRVVIALDIVGRVSRENSCSRFIPRS